jgi:CRP-like cAMP-binding protein
MTSPSESLASIPLFLSLDPSEIRRLDQRCGWRRYAPTEWIVEQEEDGDQVYFVITGGVRVILQSPERDVIFTDLPPGSFFGELSVIDGKPRSATVTALYNTLICGMPGSVFLDTVYHHPDVCRRLLRIMADRLRAVNNRVVEFSLLDVRHRVFSDLLRLAKVDPADPRRATLSPPPLQQDIAARAITRREAVSRELTRMERVGMLERRRGAWVINDRIALLEEIRRAAGEE